MGVLAPAPVPGTAVGVKPDPVAIWLPDEFAGTTPGPEGGGGIEPPGEQPMGIPVVVRAAISAGS